VKTGYLIALKFVTQKDDVRANLDTKFGWNTINTHEVICNYLLKITPPSCPQGKPYMARS